MRKVKLTADLDLGIRSQIMRLNTKVVYATDEANERLNRGDKTKRGGVSDKFARNELRNAILDNLSYKEFISTVDISILCGCSSQTACVILKRLRSKGFVENGETVRNCTNKKSTFTWRRLK